MSCPIDCPNCDAFVGEYGLSAEGTTNCPDCGHCINIANYTMAGVETEEFDPDGLEDPSEGDRVDTGVNGEGEITAMCGEDMVVIETVTGSTGVWSIDELEAIE